MGCCKSYIQEFETFSVEQDFENYLKISSIFIGPGNNRPSTESTKEIHLMQVDLIKNLEETSKSPLSYVKTLDLPLDSNDISLASWKQCKRADSSLSS
jgi:hypothetical protein